MFADTIAAPGIMHGKERVIGPTLEAARCRRRRDRTSPKWRVRFRTRRSRCHDGDELVCRQGFVPLPRAHRHRRTRREARARPRYAQGYRRAGPPQPNADAEHRVRRLRCLRPPRGATARRGVVCSRSRLPNLQSIKSKGSPEIEVEQPVAPPRVSIIMGSASDYPTMQSAEQALSSFGMDVEVRVVSAACGSLSRVPAARRTYPGWSRRSPPFRCSGFPSDRARSVASTALCPLCRCLLEFLRLSTRPCSRRAQAAIASNEALRDPVPTNPERS